MRSTLRLNYSFSKKVKINRYSQFLGVPVPEEPFPNVNDTPTMLERIRWKNITRFKLPLPFYLRTNSCVLNWMLELKFDQSPLLSKIKRAIAVTWAITAGVAGLVGFYLF